MKDSQEHRTNTARVCTVLLALLLSISGGVFSSGCSVRSVALRQLGSSLSEIGTTFSSDNDPDLIREAAPFSLKLMEGVLAQNPQHTGLLLACARGFAQYSYAYVMQDADKEEERDAQKAGELRERGLLLYLRARDYALKAIEANHPGFVNKLNQNSTAAVTELQVSDVPLMYWSAVSWAGAVSAAKNRPDLVADLPLIEALIDRAIELDESFGHGAIHVFLISLEMNRPAAPGNGEERAKRHFDRAVELTRGRACAPFVAFAESVSLARQDKADFTTLLEKALAINPDDSHEIRLENIIMQRRARWLLGRIDTLFVE